MRYFRFGVCGSIFLFAGCAAVPQPPRYDGIEVEKIVDAVQCELASVYLKNPTYAGSVQNWLARTTLDLKVINEAEFAPTITAIPTITSGALSSGVLKVPIGPDMKDQSVRIASITFDVHMRDLVPTIRGLPNPKLPRCLGDSGLPEASASLGLGDWVSTLATSAGRTDYAALSAAAYNLEFTVERGIHGGVHFVNSHVTVSADAGSVKKTNNNHMVVAFSADPAPSVSPKGKTKASPAADFKLNQEMNRFLPQRLILQPGTSINIR